jgi:hypothetical protein
MTDYDGEPGGGGTPEDVVLCEEEVSFFPEPVPDDEAVAEAKLSGVSVNHRCPEKLPKKHMGVVSSASGL